MKDDADVQLEALFAAARESVPQTSHIEFAFETRLLARLREERGGSIFAWAWRLAPFFAAIAIAAAVWSRTTMARVDSTAKVAAEASYKRDDFTLMTFLTGERQ